MFPKMTHGLFQCFQSHCGPILRPIDVKIGRITNDDDTKAIKSLLKQFEEKFEKIIFRITFFDPFWGGNWPTWGAYLNLWPLNLAHTCNQSVCTTSKHFWQKKYIFHGFIRNKPNVSKKDLRILEHVSIVTDGLFWARMTWKLVETLFVTLWANNNHFQNILRIFSKIIFWPTWGHIWPTWRR